MFKRTLVGLTVLLFVIITLLSCGDSTAPVQTNNNTLTTLITGQVIMRPYPDFLLSIQPIYAQGNEIDSIKFDDSLIRMGEGMVHVWGNQANYWGAYSNKADTARLKLGDTVMIDLFAGDSLLSVPIRLLVPPGDSVKFINSASDSLVAPNQPLTFVWQQISNADWYGMSIHYSYDSLLHHVSHSSFAATSDTIFTIPGSEHHREGSYSINVLAVTGPDPNINEQNVRNSFIVGSLYSSSRHSNYRAIVQGQRSSELPDIYDDQMTSEKILEGVLQQSRN